MSSPDAGHRPPPVMWSGLRRHRLPAALLVGMLAAGCATPRPPPGSVPDWRPSPNHDERKPNFIVLHHTSDKSAEDALRTLTDPGRKVSAHYLIGRDGHVMQLVDESRRAWHAGASYWGGLSDLNSASIGIELDNDGDEPFAEAQLSALLGLLGEVTARYEIPPANVLGHGDVAPRRKNDPSRFFPWSRLAAAGFGLWCDVGATGKGPPPEPALGLQAFGYDIADLDAAIVAFKRHFDPDAATATMTPANLAQLRCLLDHKRDRRRPAAAAANPGPGSID